LCKSLEEQPGEADMRDAPLIKEFKRGMNSAIRRKLIEAEW